MELSQNYLYAKELLYLGTLNRNEGLGICIQSLCSFFAKIYTSLAFDISTKFGVTFVEIMAL